TRMLVSPQSLGQQGKGGYLLPVVSTTVGRNVLSDIKSHLENLGFEVYSIVSLSDRAAGPDAYDALQLVEIHSGVEGSALRSRLVRDVLELTPVWQVQGLLLEEFGQIAHESVASSVIPIGGKGWMGAIKTWVGDGATPKPFRVSRASAILAFPCGVYVKCSG